MSLYLAFDTATDRGSVAVGEPGKVASEVVVGARRHAAGLVPASAEVLKLAGVSLRDLAGIIVADGPGSFTGLRIGFATALGIARQFPALATLVAPSLLGSAWLAAGFVPGVVAALYDALRGQVYAGIYRCTGGSVEVLRAPSVATFDDLRATRVDIAVGDGATVHADEVRRWTGRDPVAGTWSGPRASALIDLVRIPGALHRVEDLAGWEPAYGRPAEAQARWEQAHGKPLPGTVGDHR